jgi:predicted O-methyltransferase YrrM
MDLTLNLKQSLNVLYPDKPSGVMMCAEIGAFEGKGSIVITDYLCSNKASKLYCIDPFDNEYVKGNNTMAFWNSACNGQYERFRHNTSRYPQIMECKATSDMYIPTLENNKLDFCYIDGDHSPGQVYKDAVNILPKMKQGGVILFDDYLWEKNGVVTKNGIDRFLKEYIGKYTLLLKNYQLAVRVTSAPVSP